MYFSRCFTCNVITQHGWKCSCERVLCQPCYVTQSNSDLCYKCYNTFCIKCLTIKYEKDPSHPYYCMPCFYHIIQTIPPRFSEVLARVRSNLS